MNSNRIQILSEIIADFFAITISFLVQYWFRFHSGLVPSSISPDLQVTFITYFLILFFWYSILIFMGMYKNWYELSPIEEIWGVLKSVFSGTLIIVTLVYSASSNSPRLMFLSYLLIFSLVISLGRYSNRLIQKRLREKGILKIPIIIVGDLQSCTSFYQECVKSRNWGYLPSAFIVSDEQIEDNSTTIPTFTSLHKMSSLEFEEIVKQFNPEIIVLMKSLRKNYETLMEITSIAEDNNIRIKIEPDLYDAFTGQTQTRNLWGIPLIEINTEIIKPYQRLLKRTFDIVFSLLVILIGFPIWFIVGVIVKTTSKGPIFYVQNRIGKDGKVFKIFKFRSMTNEQKIKTPNWTSSNDPRVTPFGRFIRKSHLDEIPQFWNALIGDMSVVGPRPEQPHFVEEFTKAIPQYARRHKVRPGLTGWWQVKYTSYELSLEEIKNRLKDDFYYIENYSFKLDMEIVIRTVWLVVKGHGQT
jgi:exopolysaccharide biosynthesis polyprenyl glycosylphosphotransferase